MQRTRRFLLFLLPVFSLFFQCAAGMGDSSGSVGAGDQPSETTAESENAGLTPGESSLESDMVVIDVESPLIILDALVKAYPGKITQLALRDGDWSVQVNGRTIYWADGKMLSGSQRENAEDYRPYSFFPNPQQIPPVRVLTDQEKERLDSYISGREEKRDLRSEDYLLALWGMDGYWDSEGTVIIREFLGTRIRIHPDIEQPLKLVEAAILAAVETDPEVAEWYRSLGAIGGYVWRDIAGSANRSLHSFGIAIDVQPQSFRGKQAYWRWTADLYDEWWSIPLSDRYMFPDAVIQAFESQGFFWGGKWFLYDQIHFEYRPEIILLGEWAAGTPRD